jgi:hypothetical protein
MATRLKKPVTRIIDDWKVTMSRKGLNLIKRYGRESGFIPLALLIKLSNKNRKQKLKRRSERAKSANQKPGDGSSEADSGVTRNG